MAPFVKNPGRIVLGGGPVAQAKTTSSTSRRKGRELDNLDAGPYGLPPDLAGYAAAAGLIPEAELTPALRKLKAAAAREQVLRYERAATPWYVVLVFQSRDQRDTFMAKSGWEKHGSAKYVDGEVLAAALGLPLPLGPFGDRLKPVIGFQPPSRIALRGAMSGPSPLAGRLPEKSAAPEEPAEPEPAKPELTEAQKKLKAATKREQQQRYENTSGEFWAAIALQSAEQREAFIVEMNWSELVEDGFWVDGEAVAQQWEVEIPPAPRPGKLRQNRVYLSFAEPLPSGHEFALDHEPTDEDGDSADGDGESTSD